MLIRRSIIASLLLSGAGAALAQDQVSPQDRWAQVSACAGENSNDRRHECVDAVLRAAGALDPVREIAVNRENFGREERPAPSVAAPPAPAVPAAAVVAARPTVPAPPAPLTGITTRVASARQLGNRRLQVTTSEGAIWQQVDSDVIRRMPRAGETFEAREGALGSYRCTFNEATTFRCERRD